MKERISYETIKNALSAKELKNLLGGTGGDEGGSGSDGWDCGCAGSYCENIHGGIFICCGEDMSWCYNYVYDYYGKEYHSCGNCSGR